MPPIHKNRCFGQEPGKTFYADYHDDEWGVPVHADQKLLEMLILEGVQAGLSWETVLKKRPAYRQAFHQFVPQQVATMPDQELEALRQNAGIIRNRLKIYSARHNARIFLRIQQEYGSFDHYVWAFVAHCPIINHWQTHEEVPVATEVSDRLSRDLKKRGMNFVGSTIIYAYMQAVGMVNDHLVTCWRHQS